MGGKVSHPKCGSSSSKPSAEAASLSAPTVVGADAPDLPMEQQGPECPMLAELGLYVTSCGGR